MKRLLILLGLLASFNISAQVTGLHYEVVHEHTGVYADGVDLDGYVTVDVYLDSYAADDILIGVHGIEDGDTPGLPDALDVSFDFEGSVFQHEDAGHTGADNNCFFWPAQPSMEFDSFITFEDTTSCSIDNPFFELYTIPTSAEIIDLFEGPTNGDYFDGGDFWVDDGAYFRTCSDGDIVTEFGADQKFRVGRFTTNGDIAASLCAITCCTGDVLIDEDLLACPIDTVVNGMDTTFVICTSVIGDFACGSCAGGGGDVLECSEVWISASIEEGDCVCPFGVLVEGEVNGAPSWELEGEGFSTTGSLGFVIECVPPGDYTVYLEDEQGCVETASITVGPYPDFNIGYNLNIVDETCDNLGGIAVDVTSFTGFVGITVTDEFGIDTDISPGAWTELACGEYTLEIFDECVFETESFTIGCAPEGAVSIAATNATTDDPCNGEISFSVSGTVGDDFVFYDWYVIQSDPFVTLASNGGEINNDSFSESGSISELCPGTYSVEMFLGDCYYFESVEIFLEEELEIAVTVQEVTCPEVCDGQILIEGIGGEEPYIIECFNEEGDPVLTTGMCPGVYTCQVTDNTGTTVSTEVTLVQPEPMTYELSTIDIDCFGVCAGEVYLGNVEGGSGDYIYQFNDGDFVDDPDLGPGYLNVCAGEHSLTIVDAVLFCAVVVDFTINEPEQPQMNAQLTPPSNGEECNAELAISLEGGTGDYNVEVNLDGDLFDTFLVVMPQEEPLVLTDLCPGEYEILAFDANNCSIAETIVISDFNPILVIENVSCAGLCDGSFSTETEVAAVTCQDPFGNIVDCDALCAGEYTSSIFHDEGLYTTEFTITEPDPLFVTVESTDASCSGLCNGAIQVIDFGGGSGDFSFEVTSGDLTIDGDNISVANVCEGPVTLTLIDNVTGCTEAVFPIIESPVALEPTAIISDVLCNGELNGSVDLDCESDVAVTVLEYDVECPTTIGDLSAGVYDFVFEDENGCQASLEVTINEPELLGVTTLNQVNPECGNDCDGSFEIEASGGFGEYSYTLNSEVSSDNPVNLCIDEYVVCVIDENDCTTCVDVEVDGPEPIEFLLAVDDVTCSGMNNGTAQIFTTGGTGDIELTFAPEEINVFELEEGAYQVFALDENGCENQIEFEVGAENDNPYTIEIVSTPETCWDTNDGTATALIEFALEPIEIQWNDENNQTTVTAIGLGSYELYEVTVIDAEGCVQTASIELEPIDCFIIHDALTPNGDGANDVWTISGIEEFPNAHVQVFNRWGQLLYESKGGYIPWDGRYNGNKVGVADYYYVIEYDPNFSPITGTITVKY